LKVCQPNSYAIRDRLLTNITGCQQDVANNILIDPNGDEYQCTDTNLTPDDTNQLSTCPLDKDQMSSGAWSVLIISNNGDADPIAYERDFDLTVGLPVTTTYTPTVTVYATVFPVSTSTVTTSEYFTNTVNTTQTLPSTTFAPTKTIVPPKVTIITDRTVATVTKTKYSVVPTVVTRTKTASCLVPRRQQHPDPTCTITPTLVSAAALSTSPAQQAKGWGNFDNNNRFNNGRFNRGHRNLDRAVPLDREQRIAERKARLARGLEKRSPDNATVTVTDTNTADFITTTLTSTGTTSTVLLTSK